jgi:ATP-dependent Clp protease ATP-binding subunit ClpX
MTAERGIVKTVCPYSMSVNRTRDYSRSGATVLLELGRAFTDVLNALPLHPFGPVAKDEEWKDLLDAALVTEAGLEATFNSGSPPALKRYLVNPSAKKKGAKVDCRVTRIVATLAAGEILNGNSSMHIMELATLLATIESKLFPPPVGLVLEAKRIISVLCADGMLQVRDGPCGKALPDIRLSDRILFEIMGGARSLADVSAQAVRQMRARNGRGGSGKPKAARARARSRSAGGIASALGRVVVGQPDAVKVLSARGYLHLRRAEMLEQDKNCGNNECILFMGPSGSGKTYLAEQFGKMHSLPFASRSATDMTAVGYVGHDLTDACVHSLVRATGVSGISNQLASARYGCIFLDEWDKKRACEKGAVRDVGGTSIQHEILRLMEGAKVPLGARQRQGAAGPEFNSNGTMFIFAGAMEGLENAVRHVQQKAGAIGFASAPSTAPGMYMRDALVEFGFIPEFVNRLTAIVPFRRLETADLVKIASRPGGVISDYNAILASQGIKISLSGAALERMARVCLDSGSMARGVRSIMGSLVEKALFDSNGGAIRFGVKDVDAAAGSIC